MASCCPSSNHSSGSGDSILEEIYCILSYQGSSKDVIINYTLLVLNLLVAFLGQFVIAPTYSTPIAPHLPSDDLQNYRQRGRQQRRRRRYKYIGALFSLVFVSVFQIGLCLIVKCYGISIIWCAVGGWILMDYYNYHYKYRYSDSYIHSSSTMSNQDRNISTNSNRNTNCSMTINSGGTSRVTTMATDGDGHGKTMSNIRTPLIAEVSGIAGAGTGRTIQRSSSGLESDLDRDMDINSGDSTSIVKFKWHQLTILMIDITAIVYYLIVEDTITTVAHILAIVVLGIPLHHGTEKLSSIVYEFQHETISSQDISEPNQSDDGYFTSLGLSHLG